MLHYSDAYIVKVIQYAIYVKIKDHLHTHTRTHARTHARARARTHARTHAHTHTHPFNGPFSGTTQMSSYQKDKTNLDFTEARDSEWQWHQLGHVQVCTLLQTDNHTSTTHSVFTGRMSFLPPNQGRQSTEGKLKRHLLASYCPDTHTRTALPGPLEYRLCRLSY